MLKALDISTSALVAQQTRMNAISSNLANMSTPLDESGATTPFAQRFVVFQTDPNVGEKGALGVRVAGIHSADTAPRWKYQPGHPLAQKDGPHQGYVAYPDVNMMSEFTDALEAARAYEANLGAMEITKDLAQQTLRILA